MNTISNLASTKYQLRATVETIKKLEDSEFPYHDARLGLAEIRKAFEECNDILNLVDSDTPQSASDAACTAAFTLIKDSLDILGLLLRSTNVRNAFELQGPLLRLARRMLGEDTHLVISSEWSFSPYTLIGYDQLPGFVLIGLPATESDNPFLFPLAGHELGHSIWRGLRLSTQYHPVLQANVLNGITNRWDEFCMVFPGFKRDTIESDIFARQAWLPAMTWASRQAEEVFCDCLGVKLFGEAYLQAFAYLLAPWKEGDRAASYPNLGDRATLLARTAASYGIPDTTGYDLLFRNHAEITASDDRRTALLLAIADQARSAMYDQTVEDARSIVDKAGCGSPSKDAVERCLTRFRRMTPAENAVNLGNVFNAAWLAILEEGFFFAQKHEESKRSILGELVLKSIEILEIEHRTGRLT